MSINTKGYPKDSPQRRLSTAGRKILYYMLDENHWEFKEETGSDVGRDCIIELSENGEWKNHKIEGQIKGTKKPIFINKKTMISFPMELKTIRYALSSPIGFVLFVVDTENETVYYQCIQDYFSKNEKEYKKLNSEQKTISIHIPVFCKLTKKDNDLQEIAKKIFIPRQ